LTYENCGTMKEIPSGHHFLPLAREGIKDLTKQV